MPRSLNEHTAEDLEEVFNLAALFFTPREIARIRELNEVDFVEACDTDSSVFFRQFNGGRLQGEIDLRTGILKMAKAGSTPAQTMGMDILNKSKAKMIDR